MRFYSSSTEGPNDKLDPPTTQSQPMIPEFMPISPPQAQPYFLFYVNTYTNQFLELSNILNKELLMNNKLITLRCSEYSEQNGISQAGKVDSDATTIASNKNASQYQELPNQKNHRNHQIRKKIKTAKRKKDSENQEDSYRPDEECSRELGLTHVSESKNIPKNYGKAIINFILKNQAFVQRVIDKHGVEYDDFMQSLQYFKQNLNTIQQLKSLWLDSHNPFARVYRTISLQYLRKHSLGYIFNSRVQNFHKHIKYRYKMIESVKNPEHFTFMKEF